MGWRDGSASRRCAGSRLTPRPLTLAVLALVWFGSALPGLAQDDARMRQLRLLCAQLSGDLTDPGGIAAFRRCLATHDPLGEIRRDNNIGGGGAPTKPAADHPGANPPKGFGRDGRRSIAQGVQRFATRDGSRFYVIDKDGGLWRWNAAAKDDSRRVDEKVADIALIDDAHLLMLDTDGRLWREGDDAAGRVAIDEKVVSFQLAGTAIYVRSKDGKLWRETSEGGNRALIDQQAALFQAIDASMVYVLGSDGKLWRESGDARDRSEVASSVVAFQYLPDGDATFVLTPDGTLWRRATGSGKPEQVDRGVAAFQAVDLHLTYVLGRDGRLWQERSNRDQSVLVDSGLLVSAGRAAFEATDAQHIYVLGSDHHLWSEPMPASR